MKKSTQKRAFYHFLVGFFTVFIFSFLLFFVFEVQSADSKMKETKNNEIELIEFEERLIRQKLQAVISDLNYLKNVYGKDLYSENDLADISLDWLEFSKQREYYDQIRFLDEQGDEQIRINRDEDSYIVQDNALQNKEDRYYFKETKKIAKDCIFISPFDLNIEFGELERPYKAMIRFSRAIYNSEDEFEGMIILNYLGADVLKDFKDLAQNSRGSLVLLNEESYWLSSKDSDKQFNFMFEDRKELNFEKEYPKTWERIQAGEEQFLSDEGLVSAKKINLCNKLNIDKSSDYDGSIWYAVSIVEKNNLPALSFNKDPLLAFEIIRKNNQGSLLLVTISSLLVGFLAYSNKKKYCQIKYYSEHDILTNAYNRRAGFEYLGQMMKRKRRKKNDFSLLFVDVNGLKEVNDQLGHEYGDQLLIRVSAVILKQLEEKDLFIRLGGDEFLLVLQGTDLNEGEKIWSEIVNEFQAINESDEFPFYISLSHGLVEYHEEDNICIDDLIKEADKKMYLKKAEMKKNFSSLK